MKIYSNQKLSQQLPTSFFLIFISGISLRELRRSRHSGGFTEEGRGGEEKQREGGEEEEREKMPAVRQEILPR